MTKAELFVRNNPNADWEEILNNLIFIEEKDDEEICKLTLEEESTDVIIRNGYTDEYSVTVISLSIIFNDDSCIDLMVSFSSYDPYCKIPYERYFHTVAITECSIDSIWESKNIVSSMKKVYYVSKKDILIYTD